MTADAPQTGAGMEIEMNIVLITGASSGLGQEFAFQLDPILHKTDEIWLVARRRERLEELSKALLNRTRIFALDLTDPAQLARFVAKMRRLHVKINMLINSAGYGLMGEFALLDEKEQLGMIDLNCRALTQLTHACIPYMGENARLIQMASSAAFLPQRNFAVYAATKAYVYNLSRALGEELRQRHIFVTTVCPGPVDTEFFERAEKYGKTLSVKKLTMVSPRRVVRKALIDSYDRRAMSVCGLPIKAFHLMTRLLPHGLLLKLMGILKG